MDDVKAFGLHKQCVQPFIWGMLKEDQVLGERLWRSGISGNVKVSSQTQREVRDEYKNLGSSAPR